MVHDEIKHNTTHFYQGFWCNETSVQGVNHTILIYISQEKSFINWRVDAIYEDGVTFDTNVHWFGDFLVFMGEQKYFVRYANEDELCFGEFSKPGHFEQIKWEKVLDRTL